MLKFWYTKCLHLTTNKKYINFLMRQAKVRDYYGDVILYNYFEHLNIFKWKNSKLESCISRRELQFSYKNYLHPSSYEKDMIFVWSNLVAPAGVTWQGCTVTPVGVAWQAWHVEYVLADPFRANSFWALRSMPTWHTLSRQCMWCDSVILSRHADRRDHKVRSANFCPGGLFLK